MQSNGNGRVVVILSELEDAELDFSKNSVVKVQSIETVKIN